ncbi:MAG: hypothetical protein PHS41_01160 [Victivallaceae bacterium]|nr:hypothetical protein [Victivallaceae bacterium]
MPRLIKFLLGAVLVLAIIAVVVMLLPFLLILFVVDFFLGGTVRSSFRKFGGKVAGHTREYGHRRNQAAPPREEAQGVIPPRDEVIDISIKTKDQ